MTLSDEEVQGLLDRMSKETRVIKKNAMVMAWYSRGGFKYEDILNTSTEEREILSEIVNDNLETTKKSQLPFF